MSTFLDIDLDLSVEQALSKVRVELYRYRPFYGYLIDKMVFKESKKGELPYDTMGVDKWSRCWWTRGFVEKLKDKLFGQLVGTSVHEVMHLALRHIDRASGKTLMVNGMSLWNICTDIQSQTIQEQKRQSTRTFLHDRPPSQTGTTSTG